MTSSRAGRLPIPSLRQQFLADKLLSQGTAPGLQQILLCQNVSGSKPAEVLQQTDVEEEALEDPLGIGRTQRIPERLSTEPSG